MSSGLFRILHQLTVTAIIQPQLRVVRVSALDYLRDYPVGKHLSVAAALSAYKGYAASYVYIHGVAVNAYADLDLGELAAALARSAVNRLLNRLRNGLSRGLGGGLCRPNRLVNLGFFGFGYLGRQLRYHRHADLLLLGSGSGKIEQNMRGNRLAVLHKATLVGYVIFGTSFVDVLNRGSYRLGVDTRSNRHRLCRIKLGSMLRVSCLLTALVNVNAANILWKIGGCGVPKQAFADVFDPKTAISAADRGRKCTNLLFGGSFVRRSAMSEHDKNAALLCASAH